MKLDNYEWQSDFARNHIAEGRAEGVVHGMKWATLQVLDARGLLVSDDVRDQESDRGPYVLTIRGVRHEGEEPGPYTWPVKFALQHRANGMMQGFAEGMARAVVMALGARDIPVSDDLSDRIYACADLDQLRLLVRRAVTMGTDEGLFI